MTVLFFGLTGASGVMPRHYTELLMRIEREGKGREKYALRDWLDLFNHRAISLFYRAWEKYRFFIPYERREFERGAGDPFTQALFSFVGLGTQGTKNRLKVVSRDVVGDQPRERVLARVDDLALLMYGGHLLQQRRSAIGLAQVLSDYFKTDVHVHQFQGQWLRLDAENQSRLGAPGGNNQLGSDLVAGTRVWDVQGKIRIRVGPLPYADFREFMPDRTPVPRQKRLFELIHLVRFYVGPELDFDVLVLLEAGDVPECQMPVGTAFGPQLGWNTWLTSTKFAKPAKDAVFEGEVVVDVSKPAMTV